ncbi:MAG: hypothetical protein LQ339_006897 [Xanthoria mediterranea]|nr:MAG: hypothetical protein LQ339_006897 [Xanthoria mediterranea]
MAFPQIPTLLTDEVIKALGGIMGLCLDRIDSLSSLRAFDQPAEILFCTFSWQRLRLRQLKDKASMVLCSNDAVPSIRDDMRTLFRDLGLAARFRVILDQGASEEHTTTGKADNNDGPNTFSRLFEKPSMDTAPKSRVLEIDMGQMQKFSFGVANIVGRLYDILEIHQRMELLKVQRRDLEKAILRSTSTSDREIVYHLVEGVSGFEYPRDMNLKRGIYNQQLLEAIDEDNEKTVESLIDQGASVNFKYTLGCSPLSFSAHKGRLRISEILLGHGADPKAMTTRLPQHSAAEGGHTEVLQLLLSQDHVDPSAVDSFGRTALHYASASGNLTAVQLLLNLGGIAVDSVDQGGSTPLSDAMAGPLSRPCSESGLELSLPETEIIRQLLARPEVNPHRQHTGYNGLTLLGLSISRGNNTIMEMLLARPDVSIHRLSPRSGVRPLYMAYLHSNEPAFRLLLEKGADIHDWTYRSWNSPPLYNRQRKLTTGFLGQWYFLASALSYKHILVDKEDSRKRTLLIDAAEQGHAVVRVLLDYGASVSKSDDQGRTALSWAAAVGHKEIVEMLLGANADIHHRDNDGHSPLVLAVANFWYSPEEGTPQHFQAYLDMIWSLLKRGANPGDVSSTPNLPCDPAYWAEAQGLFEGIIKGFHKNPDRRIMADFAHLSLQGMAAESKSTKKDEKKYEGVDINEGDVNSVPKPTESISSDDEGASKQLECMPNQGAAEPSEGVPSEGNKENRDDKPIAPVLHLELEDEFSAKLQL